MQALTYLLSCMGHFLAAHHWQSVSSVTAGAVWQLLSLDAPGWTTTGLYSVTRLEDPVSQGIQFHRVFTEDPRSGFTQYGRHGQPHV